MRSAVVDKEWIAMTQGVDIVSNKTVEITKVEHLTVDAGVVTIAGTPVGDVATLQFSGSLEKDVDVTAGLDAAITTLGAVDGDEIQVSYKEEVVGDSIEFDSQKFSKSMSLEMRTIAYDLETAEVISDIYFIFPNVLAGSDFSMSFEAGQVITPEISFSVLQPKNSTVLGEMVDVPRKTTP